MGSGPDTSSQTASAKRRFTRSYWRQSSARKTGRVWAMWQSGQSPSLEKP